MRYYAQKSGGDKICTCYCFRRSISHENYVSRKEGKLMIKILFANADKKALIKTVYLAALGHFGVDDVFDIDITFVGEKAIRKLNCEYRNVDKITDVLSFPNVEIKLPVNITEYPLDINPETGRLSLGDIMICNKKAKAQAKEYGHSEARETAFLALHGILHLLGFDHVKKKDEQIMNEHQKAILQKVNISR
ncbi:MAG: rRNA maturation RNase YbeY [Clostridia bacterium]|nr:rRNA maturation RNase YbeY [Clostridia bacterium]